MFNFMEEVPTKEMNRNIYIRITDLFKELRNSYENTFYRIMNPGEEPLTEDEKLMLSNPADRLKYLAALEELQKARENGEINKEVVVDLSNGKKITLITVS